MKEAAYKRLVRPVLEYGSSVWDPHTHGLQEELEKVQKRAARIVTGNFVFETGSMTGVLGQLKWTLTAQCKGNMLKYLLNKNKKKKISSRLKSSLRSVSSLSHFIFQQLT